MSRNQIRRVVQSEKHISNHKKFIFLQMAVRPSYICSISKLHLPCRDINMTIDSLFPALVDMQRFPPYMNRQIGSFLSGIFVRIEETGTNGAFP